MAIMNNDQWKGFIEKYKSLPELWKVKSDNYKNKNIGNKAWEELLISYKQIDPDGTLESLKKRLNNMGTCYRRELKKLEKTAKSGAGVDDLYEPNLWYFDELNFLRDQETQLPGISSIDFDEDTTDTNDDITKSMKKKRGIGRNDYRQQYLQRPVEHLEKLKETREKEKDDAAIYAESWAVSFRKITDEQQLYAKKALDDILILGQIGKLTLNSVTAPSGTRLLSSTPSQRTDNYTTPSTSSASIILFEPSSPPPQSQPYDNCEYVGLAQLIRDTHYQ